MWLMAIASALLILNIPLTAVEYHANSALDWFPVTTKMVSSSQELYSKSLLNHITKMLCDVCRVIQLQMTLGCVLIAWIYFIVFLNCNQVTRCYSFFNQSITPCIHGCQPQELSKHSSGTFLVYIHTLVQCSFLSQKRLELDTNSQTHTVRIINHLLRNRFQLLILLGYFRLCFFNSQK